MSVFGLFEFFTPQALWLLLLLPGWWLWRHLRRKDAIVFSRTSVLASGPHTGGCVDCNGLATVERSTGAVTLNADYYALGHVSKFVQRGAYRIGSTLTHRPSTGLYSRLRKL